MHHVSCPFQIYIQSFKEIAKFLGKKYITTCLE